MTSLSDILNTQDLAHMVQEGYIRRQVHPTLPYQILNYAEKAQFEGAWNNETMTCRGLITTFDGDVLARPFRKFFNLGQSESPNTPDIPWHEEYRVYDKADGSLGILYPTDDGYAIATRGSFDSEQARHATRVWNERYAGTFTIPTEWTMLFEIVYPENRIVLDYGDTDDLILLGAVNIATGRTLDAHVTSLATDWPGPIVESYPTRALDELVNEDRPNKEGYVLWFPKSDFRVKVKHDTYLQLHRVITNANTKNVWRALSEGNMEEIYALPDEFRTGIDAYVRKLNRQYRDIETACIAWNDARLLKNLEPGRETAEWIIANSITPTIRSVLFSMVSGKDYAPIIWKSLKPAQAEGLWGQTEAKE